MSAEPDAQHIQHLAAIRQRLQADGFTNQDETPGPIWWPALTAEEAAAEWDPLRHWVARFCTRFPHAMRIPACWWRHNDLVEGLSALRDFERACFSPTAPATAAVEWHRALRDMTSCMEMWAKRFNCFRERGHDLDEPTQEPPRGWVEFVAADVQARRQRDPQVSLDD
jgi:hypothetical protein